MIGTLSLALAALFATAQAASVPPAEQASAGWYDTMIRRDTARRIADDLPKTPRRFRFACRFVQLTPSSFVHHRLCVAADAQPVTDPAQLADQARREAARPDLTPEDRMRRTAWLRAMLLHQRFRAEPSETFIVEETVAASDLAGGPASTGEAAREEIAYAQRPAVNYPPSALRTNTQGLIELRCTVIAGGQLHCETLTPYFTGPLANPDGSLATPKLLALVTEAHRASLATRIAPTTRNGKQTEGLSLTYKVDFRLPD